jgi:hypothetical protein
LKVPVVNGYNSMLCRSIHLRHTSTVYAGASGAEREDELLVDDGGAEAGVATGCGIGAIGAGIAGFAGTGGRDCLIPADIEAIVSAIPPSIGSSNSSHSLGFQVGPPKRSAPASAQSISEALSG